MSRWTVAAVLVACAGLLWALAEPPQPVLVQPLDVASLSGRVPLGVGVEVFDDEGAEATIADVRGRHASAFRRSDQGYVARGMTASAVWMRLTIVNGSAREAQWVLEVDEPTLDDVRLYVVHDDGHVVTRQTGDLWPFRTRDVASNNFVFQLSEQPGARSTLYLRVASQEPVRAPIAAYRLLDWVAKHERDNFLNLALYGGLLAVTLYYFCVFVVMREPEYMWCALLHLAELTVLASLYGHVAQFVLPSHPQLANLMLPVAIAGGMLAATKFIAFALRRISVSERVRAVTTAATFGCAALLVFALLVPTRVSLYVLCVILVLVCAIGRHLIKVIDTTRYRDLRFIKVGWQVMNVTTPVAILRYVDLLPRHPLLDLALPLGFLLHGGATSLGLTQWVRQIREKVSTMNTELKENVFNLQLALSRAEEAGKRAERATMVKDDFMATMSHELRTPLNAIINIPQGMISDFETVRSARCRACDAEYLLDPGDHVDADTECEECLGRGTLAPGTKVLFHGEPSRTLHFLKKIERSGNHLLQMVNGVLDYSKLEAGRFELTLEPGDLEALCREAVDQVSDLAAARNLQLVLTKLSALPEMTFDALRIKQVLINLLSNAIKFSEPGGVVGIALGREGDVSVIEVQDAGIGIALENHERIFAGFEQVHKGDTRKYGGTGLGLSISRSLVRMHGGELSVRSELGKGATFIVRLPRMPHLGSQVDSSELKPFTQRELGKPKRRSSTA